ncbi:hypothetical protein LT493_11570 [Streptomyces tricolor]|nr:hypothetical protein [Streptomyces tricolor]
MPATPRHFDVDTHFTPRYAPWDQRLCVVPDGDLFKAISAGRASVVTDHIDRFTKTGIPLKSGQELTADIVVTATGLHHVALRRNPAERRRPRDESPDTMAYKAMMLRRAEPPSSRSATPTSRGRSRSIWSASISPPARPLLDAHGYDIVAAVLDDPTVERVPYMNLRSNYVLRGIGEFPGRGRAAHGRWRWRTRGSSSGCVRDRSRTAPSASPPAARCRRPGRRRRGKRDLTFVSHGARCAAWHVPAGSDASAGPGGRPCVVMAHRPSAAPGTAAC